MQLYKIGTISKILNIPVESIRYLEKQGLISPKKDDQSGYRFYDVWDVNRILDYKKYRQIGFSSKETVDIVQKGELKTLIAQLEGKKDEAAYLAGYYRAKMLKLKNFQAVLTYAPEIVGKYLIMNRPENYSLFTRSYDGKEVYHAHAMDTEGGFEELTNHYPFVEHIYRIKKDWFHKSNQQDEAELGFTVKKQWVDELNISLLPKMEHVDTVPSIFTIVRMGEKQFFSIEVLKDIFAYMKQGGYQLCGDIMGIYLATVVENNKKVRYMEVWVPIEAADRYENECSDEMFTEINRIFA